MDRGWRDRQELPCGRVGGPEGKHQEVKKERGTDLQLAKDQNPSTGKRKMRTGPLQRGQPQLRQTL